MVPAALRQMVLEELHNKSGHLRIHKIMEKVRERFFWQGCEQDVRNIVQQCEQCQKELTLFQLRMLPLALLRAITHLRSSRGTLWAHCR